MKRLLRLDWDAVPGIAAAVAALVLHFMHIVEAETILTMVLLLLALLLLRDLRREHEQGRLTEYIERTATAVVKMQAALQPPDALLTRTSAEGPGVYRLREGAAANLVNASRRCVVHHGGDGT